MAHFAKLDSNNVVTEVIVISNDTLIGIDGQESEQNGINFLNSLYGFYPRWIQTSYNSNFRKNFASIGYTYDSTRDAFIEPKPYESWVLNETTCQWEAPVVMPDDDNAYSWNEEEQQWDLTGTE